VDLRTAKVLANYRESDLFAPASNQKILTSAFAMTRLGGSFQFVTRACRAGNDVWVIGSGDPTFGDPLVAAEANGTIYDELDRWATAIKAAMPGGIPGDLIVCRAVCPGQATPQEGYRHADWPKDQWHTWYCAPVGALNFNDNCIDVTFKLASGKITPKFLPESRFIQIVNKIQPGAKQLWSMALGRDDSVATLSGTAKASSPTPLNVPVNNPPVFFARIFADRLERAGVKIAGKIAIADALPPDAASWPELCRTATALPVAIRRANKRSLNMAAEGIFLRAGDGTWAGSAKLMSETLQKEFGIGEKSLVVRDGSGLSREDRATPLAFVKVLSVIAARSDAQTLVKSLPIAGVDGTMERRLDSLPYRGRVLAKTGYIAGVSCLSGYVLDESERPAVAMSVLCGQAAGPGPSKKLEDTVASILVDWLDGKR